MLKPYELLENILLDIENNIKNDMDTSILCKKYNISNSHLRRLFTFAFKHSIATYIRSRKLAASLDDILKSDTAIWEISDEYGFEYEQSFIRTFKREFGLTPGDLRKTGEIIKITPPLRLFNENKVGDDILLGPDIVMVPRFHIIGKRHRIPSEDYAEMIPKLGTKFLENERNQIKAAVNPNIYIGLSSNKETDEKYFDYMSSVQVANLKKIPHGFCGDTFETSMCARFRYIGQHHLYNTNKNVVSMIYNVAYGFSQNLPKKYVLLIDKIHFERIDTSLYDGPFCQIEFLTPISEKQ
jgi:AraC family transcriptional regulator